MKQIFIVLSFIFLQNNPANAQQSFVETSGDILQMAIPAAAFASTYCYKDSRKPGWQFAKVYATQLIVSQALKHIVNKPRPENNGNYSFPSGHTSSAFSGAAFIGKKYGWKAGLPAYILASYVGWSRIDARKHDPWDVLAGASIGIGSAYIFTKPYQKSNIDLGFSKFENKYVVSLNYSF